MKRLARSSREGIVGTCASSTAVTTFKLLGGLAHRLFAGQARILDYFWPAIEHAQHTRNAEEPSLEATGDYKVVLDEMADAMNHLVEETHSPSRVGVKRQRPARVPKDDSTLRAAKTMS